MLRLSLLLALPLIAGCATYTAQALPQISAGHLVNRDKWGDLTIGAKLPASSDEVIRYFGVDLLDDDILPVSIYVSNASSSTAYTIRAEDISFTLPGGQALRPQTPRKVADRTGATDPMYNDYCEKCFTDVNLPQGDPKTIRRVVFFRTPSRLPLEESDYQNGELTVRVTRYQVSGEDAGESPEKSLKIYFRK